MPLSPMRVQWVLLAAIVASGCVFKFDRNLGPGTLQGTAVYRNAQGALVPASAATVTLENSSLSVTADSQGTFVLEGLPAGTFAVDITDSPGGLVSGEVGLRLVGLTIGTADGLDLGQVQLDALGAIQGTLTVDGNVPGPGAIATIVGLAQVPVSDGIFKFAVLLPGPYQVTVFDPTNPAGPLVSPVASVQVAPAATAQTSFVLSSESNQATASAVQGLVQVSGASDNSNVDVQFSGNGPGLTTSSSGTYASGGVPAGLYTVTASLGGFSTVSVPYVLVGTGTTVVPTITMLPVASGSTPDAGPQTTCAVDSECPAGQVCLAGICGIAVDGGPVDAGPEDAGPPDSGPTVIDAGPPDSGPTVIDAGPPDSGPTAIDAGPPDSGLTEMDAGPPDSGSTVVVDAGTGVAAPSGLSYSPNPASYLIWETITPSTPTVGGGAVASYSITPALPTGLSLDTTTGVISGTVTTVSPSTTYTVTAENSGGSTTCSLSITVGSSPVSGTGAVLAMGSATGCAIVAGGLMCWGSNESGQFGNNSVMSSETPVPSDLTSGVQAVTVSADGDFNCAVVNGAAECWGLNTDGQLGNNSTAESNVPAQVLGLTSGVQAIATGVSHACALVNGGAQCWGSNEYDQLGNGESGGSSLVPVQVTGLTTGAVAIAAGMEHSCALVNGGIKCWGDDGYGELGNNSQSYAPTPVSVTNPNGAGVLSGVQAIAAGDYVTCAIVNGGVDCWGEGSYGELGNNTTANMSLVPLPVPGLTSGVQAIAAGGNNICAVVGGGVQCWGASSVGGSSVPVAVANLTGVQAIAAGEFDTCALTDNSVQCWGYNGQGQIGDNTASGGANVTVPVPVWGLSNGVTGITSGEFHTCAIVNGGVQCWGIDNNGELGNDSTVNSGVPVPVAALSNVETIAADPGGYHTCAIANGGVQCWGYNTSGQLGNNSTSDGDIPVQVTGLTSGVLAIAAGEQTTCAIVNGSVQCWGSDGFGELGNNSSTTSSLVPVQILGVNGAGQLSDVQAIAEGVYHACALVNGGVQCWGYNTTGQLGNNAMTNDSPVPVQVVSASGTGQLTNVQAIVAGSYHTCALVGGGAWCWGENNDGQLGINSITSSAVPTQVVGLTSGVQALAAGGNFTCALVNGAVDCWGENNEGQLGDNTFTNSPVPVAVPGLTSGVEALAAGNSHACALVNGAIECWGDNQDGDLGNNSSLTSPVPVAISPWAQ